MLAARAIAKDTSGVSINVDGENRTGPLYRSVRASDLKGPLKVTNTGDAPLQAVVSVTGAPLTPEPAAEKGFKIERTFYTLAGEVADPSKVKQNDRFAVVLKMTEAQPQFGRIVVADYLPAGFEIDNPRIVSSGDTGTLSWIEDAVPPAFSEFRDDRFTAAFDREAKSPAVFTVAYVVRAVSPGRYVLPQAYCRGYVPARPLRPHRYRHDRDHGEMSVGSRRRLRIAGAVALLATALVLVAGGWWVNSLGPAPLGRDLDYSTLVVDREGRLLRPFATSEGRWRLPATEAGVDPRYLDLLLAYEDKRFRSHHGVDPLALLRAAYLFVTNGRIVSGGSTLTMQVARLLEPRASATFTGKLREMVRALQLERALEQGRDPRALSQPRALRRQPRGRARRLARLFRQGAAAALARRGRAARGAAAIAGGAASGSRRSKRARKARDRVLDRAARPAGVVMPVRHEIAWAKAEPVPAGRRPMPMLAPHAADAALATAPARKLCIASPSMRAGSAASRSSRASARGRSGRTCRSPSSRSITHRRSARARGVGRLFRRTPRRPGRHDAGAALARLGAQALHLRPRLRGRVHPSGDADRRSAGALRQLRAGEFRSHASRARSACAARCSCRSTCRRSRCSTRPARAASRRD